MYEQAKAKTPKNADGSVSEADLRRELKRIIPFDEDAIREREAKRIINSLCKPVPGHHEGQLCFEGFGTWSYDPHLLIRSDDGLLIENYKATPRFKLADARRSARHADEALASSRRKQHESDVFMEWALEQQRKGIKETDITWGCCIEALGVLNPLGTDDSDEDNQNAEDE